MDKLSNDQIAKNLNEVPEWHQVGDAISRQFVFKDFAQAFSFMQTLAIKFDAQSHHPDWSNSYNKLVISFTSHDVGGLTSKDFEMAKLVDDNYTEAS